MEVTSSRKFQTFGRSIWRYASRYFTSHIW